MVTRTLQRETRRKRDPESGEIVNEWAGYRVSVPKAIVEALGWEGGTRLAFTITGAGRVELREQKGTSRTDE